MDYIRRNQPEEIHPHTNLKRFINSDTKPKKQESEKQEETHSILSLAIEHVTNNHGHFPELKFLNGELASVTPENIRAIDGLIIVAVTKFEETVSAIHADKAWENAREELVSAMQFIMGVVNPVIVCPGRPSSPRETSAQPTLSQ